MVEIILKDNIEKNKIDTLLQFLKSLNINAELKRNVSPANKKKTEFSLSTGILGNYKVDAGELRKEAWKRKK